MSLITRRLLLLTAAVALCGTTVGAAASLSLATNGIGAARQSVPRCTTGALALVPNFAGASSNVGSVTVSGLPSTCGGATLQVAFNNGTTSSSGSASVPSGGGSVTVTLAVSVAAATTEESDLVIVGP